jgi:hypothetical protein
VRGAISMLEIDDIHLSKRSTINTNVLTRNRAECSNFHALTVSLLSEIGQSAQIFMHLLHHCYQKYDRGLKFSCTTASLLSEIGEGSNFHAPSDTYCIIPIRNRTESFNFHAPTTSLLSEIGQKA